MKEVLVKYGFDADTPILRGSALCTLEGRDDEIGKQSVLKLLEVVDEWIPVPKRENDKPFLMPIETTYSIQGRGTVVSGKVERGCLKLGTEVEILGRNNLKAKITGRCG